MKGLSISLIECFDLVSPKRGAKIIVDSNKKFSCMIIFVSFLCFLFKSPSQANEKCLYSLLSYGKNYGLAYFKEGKVVNREQWEDEWGPKGELSSITTYQVGDDWATVFDCVACTPPEKIIQALYLTKIESNLLCGLKLGMSKKQVEIILGKPEDLDIEPGAENRLSYQVFDDCGPTPIRLDFKNGKFRGLKWTFNEGC